MKKKVDLRITIEEILEIFWFGSENSYANPKIKAERNPLSPNEKTITIRRGPHFIYEDKWITTPVSNKSAGTTTIMYCHNDIWIPVWWMCYSGGYPKNVIPFLKKALMANYHQKIFRGGRGPIFFEDEEYPDLVYTSDLDTKDNFKKFSGEETIHKQDEESGELIEPLGYHSFHGVSMLPD